MAAQEIKRKRTPASERTQPTQCCLWFKFPDPPLNLKAALDYCWSDVHYGDISLTMSVWSIECVTGLSLHAKVHKNFNVIGVLVYILLFQESSTGDQLRRRDWPCGMGRKIRKRSQRIWLGPPGLQSRSSGILYLNATQRVKPTTLDALWFCLIEVSPITFSPFLSLQILCIISLGGESTRQSHCSKFRHRKTLNGCLGTNCTCYSRTSLRPYDIYRLLIIHIFFPVFGKLYKAIFPLSHTIFLFLM